MDVPHRRIIDNRAGFVEPEEEGAVEEVFRHFFRKLIDEPQSPDSDNVRIDIGSGYLFLSGFEFILPEIESLVEKGRIRCVTGDPDWGTRAPIRVVMGAEATRQTKSTLLKLIRSSIADYPNQTLRTLAEFLRKGIIEFRTYTERKFHAKVFSFYTASKFPAETWVGSANLSQGGLRENIELCVPVEFRHERTQQLYRKWFDSLWSRSSSDLDLVDIIEEIESSDYIYEDPRLFFSKLIKLLDKGYLLDPIEQATGESILLGFQTLSYSIVMDRLKRYGGFILANSVGLGKTFVAAQAMNYMTRLNPLYKCLLIRPPRLATEWNEVLKLYGISDHVVRISRGVLQKPSFDCGLPGAFDAKEHAKKYSLIVVDEAHHFRNPCNRRRNLDEIIRLNPQAHILLMTATPVNLGVRDLFALIDLFYRGDVAGRFSSQGLKALYDRTRRQVLDSEYDSISASTVRSIRQIENELVLKVSWRIVQQHFESDLRRLSNSAATYHEPIIKEVSYRYERRLVKDVFDKIIPFLERLSYEPAKLWDGEGYRDDKNLTFWYKWQLYKRLESSLYAFYESIENMAIRFSIYHKTLSIGKLLDSESQELSEIGIRRDDFESKVDVRRYHVVFNTFLTLDESTRQMIIERTGSDLQIVNEMLITLRQSLGDIKHCPLSGDTKIDKLKVILRQIKGPCIVFSQFADTIDYLAKSLRDSGFKYDAIHGRMKRKKDQLLKRFEAGDFDLLLTSDVLSEGVSIPRADFVINFDLPYNPVLLVQRAGRALRITRPKTLRVFNFVPSPIIDKELDLYRKLDVRLKTIVDIVGIDFVIWMLERRKMRTFQQREREKFLRSYEEYRKLVSTTNPDDLVMRVTLPFECTVDRALERAISRYSLTQLDLETATRATRPFFTTLFGESGVAVASTDKHASASIQGLRDQVEPLGAKLMPEWTRQEIEKLLNERRDQLQRESISRGSLSRADARLVRRLAEVYYLIQGEQKRSIIGRIRHLAESQSLTGSQREVIEQFCSTILDTSSLVDDISVNAVAGWDELERMADGTPSDNSGALSVAAVIVYGEQG